MGVPAFAMEEGAAGEDEGPNCGALDCPELIAEPPTGNAEEGVEEATCGSTAGCMCMGEDCVAESEGEGEGDDDDDDHQTFGGGSAGDAGGGHSGGGGGGGGGGSSSGDDDDSEDSADYDDDHHEDDPRDPIGFVEGTGNFSFWALLRDPFQPWGGSGGVTSGAGDPTDPLQQGQCPNGEIPEAVAVETGQCERHLGMPPLGGGGLTLPGGGPGGFSPGSGGPNLGGFDLGGGSGSAYQCSYLCPYWCPSSGDLIPMTAKPGKVRTGPCFGSLSVP